MTGTGGAATDAGSGGKGGTSSGAGGPATGGRGGGGGVGGGSGGAGVTSVGGGASGVDASGGDATGGSARESGGSSAGTGGRSGSGGAATTSTTTTNHASGCSCTIQDRESASNRKGRWGLLFGVVVVLALRGVTCAARQCAQTFRRKAYSTAAVLKSWRNLRCGGAGRLTAALVARHRPVGCKALRPCLVPGRGQLCWQIGRRAEVHLVRGLATEC